ncbi:MAG TPA: hypothetical protein VHH15_05290, partial [Actinophytocola sp.]|nr:hypothetical protein [Actinophytocola sp.]
GVEVSPSELAERAPHDWGAVRPSFPPSADGAQLAAPGGYAPPTSTEPRAVEPAATVDEAADLPVGLVVALGLGTVALAGWVGRRHLRANRHGR